MVFTTIPIPMIMPLPIMDTPTKFLMVPEATWGERCRLSRGEIGVSGLSLLELEGMSFIFSVVFQSRDLHFEISSRNTRWAGPLASVLTNHTYKNEQ
jgi:hypothetical protein